MFEKEADYRKARKESKDQITKVIKVWSAREEELHDKGFQNGAEYGYNKANEWHYVKDEGTPIVEGHYLVCLRNKNKDIFDCWIYYDKDIGWYSMKVRMKDIYAWKEIVLPEEIKEK